MIMRPRPFEAGIISVFLPAYYALGDFNAWNSSFPSFQAVLAFSAIPILSREFKKFKFVWLAFACLIAFSRVYFGLHYASDVLFGAVIGYIIGYLVVGFENRYLFGEKMAGLFNKGIKRMFKE